ncbi:MAG: DUF2589 domain-containing protein [Sphaerochaetaceae bacterium]
MSEDHDSALEETLKGIPLTTLISAPLKAAAEAQKMLAKTTIDFVEEVGFSRDGDSRSARMVEFSVRRPAETPNGIEVSELSVQAPLLSLVPSPSLAVEEIMVDFQMEVTSTEQRESTQDSDVQGENHSRDDGVVMSGRVASSASNTRSTDQSAKYQVHVVAKKQEPTEGYSRLLDVLSSCVASTKPKEEA